MLLTDEAKEAARYLAAAWEEGRVDKLSMYVGVTAGSDPTIETIPFKGVPNPEAFECPPLADLLELHEFGLIAVTEETTGTGGGRWTIRLKQELKNMVQNDFSQQRITDTQGSNLARIFISYSHGDTDRRRAIQSPLAKAYDDVWSDEEFRGGEEWWKDILDHIAKRDIFIYLLSPDSVKSKYCRSEFAEAYRLRKQILPIVIDRKTKPPNYISSRYHYKTIIRGLFSMFKGRFQRLLKRPPTSVYNVDAIIRLFAATIKSAAEIQGGPPDPRWARQTPYPENPTYVKVPARIKPKDEKQELNTGILLLPGDKITIGAGGKITVDDGQTRTGPEGTFADERAFRAVGRPNPEPGKENWGVVGSLIGWIGDSSLASDKAFFVGAELTKTVEEGEEGFLYLAVNDQKHAYGDNHGEFEATITVNWVDR